MGRRRRPARSNEPSSALGRALASAREQAGMSAQELSACAGIPRHFVDHIESGRLDLIPVVAHARGYMRTYASAVGLDPDAVTMAMCRFDQRARFINRELADLVTL